MERRASPQVRALYLCQRLLHAAPHIVVSFFVVRFDSSTETSDSLQ